MMKLTNKSVGSVLLAAIIAFSFNSCYAKRIDSQDVSIPNRQSASVQADIGSTMSYENNGLHLSIPRKYADLLIVDTPKNNGRLFVVSEKASIEADKAHGGTGEGAGWLFSIGAISEIQLYDMLQHDMSGAEIFARDDSGIYYVYYHPTDVRLVRDNYDQSDAIKDWTMLNEWAAGTVRERFISDNNGFTAETYGNAELDIFLARAAFGDGIQYTVSTSECAPWYPTVINPTPYAMRLIRNAQVEALDSATAPAGDYVALNFSEDHVRFDFFLAKGSENIYRQTLGDSNEQLFRINFADGHTKAVDVMKEWYDALAAADDRRALGYTPDSLVGRWAEKIAGRGLITVARGGKGTYDVLIEWADSAAEKHIWEMTARPYDESGVLHYDRGRHLIRTYTVSGDFIEKTVYENGTGKFYINSAGELMWQDNEEGAGDNTVFVNCDDEHADSPSFDGSFDLKYHMEYNS